MINKAEERDIPQLLRIVNAAYRGDESRKGWTTEADLIEGDARADEQVLSALIRRSGSVILKFVEGGQLLGCVHLERQGEKLYLGMLSVEPGMQGKNIGKKLLFAAEEYGMQTSVSAIVMNVISARHELIRWYEKHGYKKTGERKPFPSDNKFGVP